jgi:phosphoribosylamine--glycine ligase
MNILLLGSGGREHAFAWKMIQSPLCDTLCIPGNAGTAEIANNVAIAVTDFDTIKALVIEKTSKWLLLGQKTHWSKESTIFLE